jgi:hypothetical protein
MRKTFLFIFLIIFLASLHSSYASYYSVNPDCQGECVKDYFMNWDIEIENKNSQPLRIISVRIIDVKTNETIVQSKEGKYISSDKTNENAIRNLQTRDKTTYNLTSKVPQGTSENNTLKYGFCFSQRPEKDAWQDAGENYEFCFRNHKPIKIIDCKVDQDCKENGFCSDGVCTNLLCDKCQYAENHECKDYECCENNHCSLSQTCFENSCQDLNCNGTFYVVNHTCSSQPCNLNEALVNYTCVENPCNQNQELINYTCQDLNCSHNKTAFNHTCIYLNCSESQGYKNNSCYNLNCSFDQKIENHRCKKLNCGFLFKAENHSCLVDTILFLEISLFLALIFLLFIDFKVYDSWHRRKLADFFLRKAKYHRKKIQKDKNKKT